MGAGTPVVALGWRIAAGTPGHAAGHLAFLIDGTKYVVKETVDEVLVEIREYRAGILATSYEMDRGEYHPGTPEAQPPAQAAGESSVVPFPSREER